MAMLNEAHLPRDGSQPTRPTQDGEGTAGEPKQPCSSGGRGTGSNHQPGFLKKQSLPNPKKRRVLFLIYRHSPEPWADTGMGLSLNHLAFASSLWEWLCRGRWQGRESSTPPLGQGCGGGGSPGKEVRPSAPQPRPLTTVQGQEIRGQILPQRGNSMLGHRFWVSSYRWPLQKDTLLLRSICQHPPGEPGVGGLDPEPFAADGGGRTGSLLPAEQILHHHGMAPPWTNSCLRSPTVMWQLSRWTL